MDGCDSAFKLYSLVKFTVKFHCICICSVHVYNTKKCYRLTRTFMRTSAVRLLWIKMNGMQHNLIGQKRNCRRSPGLFFLKFWLGGIRWYKVRHTASNHKNVERSSCYVSSVSLRPIISNNPTNYYQTISTYVQTIKLQKVPKMPNKS